MGQVVLDCNSMSNAIVDEGEPVPLGHLIQCLSNWRIASGIAIASAALIFYDWLLTSSDEFDFLWQRSRSTFTRMLFILARYPALACAIVGLFPPTIKLNNVRTCLTVVTIASSEFILAMRTWAIWERSRPILVFLVILFVICATPGIVIAERDINTSVVVPSTTWGSVQPCRVLASVVKRVWVVPYIGIMMFEVVILSMTLYRVLQYYKVNPRTRSRLLDALWIDGVIYFGFMLLIGILNVGLALNVSDPQLRVSCTQLQTVMHSILSTRIVLHTGRVLRKGVDTRPTFVQNQLPAKLILAGASDVSIERRTASGHGIMMDSEVELEWLINNNNNDM